MKFLALILAAAIAQPVQAQCRLCVPGNEAKPVTPTVPLQIAIDTTLDLGRAAHQRMGGAGTVALDARSGTRSVGGNLVDLGGLSMRGVIRLSGAPLAPVTITIPSRIALTAGDGSTADLLEIRSDASPNPTLDLLGRLTVNFGGRLIVTSGAAGDFRGRVAITADYR